MPERIVLTENHANSKSVINFKSSVISGGPNAENDAGSVIKTV